MEENKIGHIYTAKMSKSGRYVNLTIVYEENENRRFITVPVLVMSGSDAFEYKGKKPYAIKCQNDDYCEIALHLIKEKKEAVKPEPVKKEAVKADADEMPF